MENEIKKNEAEDKMAEIIEELGKALSRISEEEKQFLREAQKQIDEVAKVQGKDFDRRLEFCYTITLNPDKIVSKRLIQAAREYIKAVEKENK